MLPDKAIEEFQELYFQENKEIISFSNASENATTLFSLMKAIVHPIHTKNDKSITDTKSNNLKS